MENTKVNEQQVVVDTTAHKDSPTVARKEIDKWLKQTCVNIKDSDFNTTPRGHRLHNSEYWEEYNEYIDEFENC